MIGSAAETRPEQPTPTRAGGLRKASPRYVPVPLTVPAAGVRGHRSPVPPAPRRHTRACEFRSRRGPLSVGEGEPEALLELCVICCVDRAVAVVVQVGVVGGV